MRRVMLAVALDAQQRKAETTLDPDVVDLRWMGKDDKLDRLIARAKGIDPDQVRLPGKEDLILVYADCRRMIR